MTSLNTEHASAIAQGFRDKALQSALKQGTKAYRVAHFDYFYGSMQTLHIIGFEIPPIWSLYLMSGRDISDDGKPI